MKVSLASKSLLGRECDWFQENLARDALVGMAAAVSV